MNIITKIRHKLGKLLWSENEWTKAVDDIEKAAEQISMGSKDRVILNWEFSYFKLPKRFKITVEANRFNEKVEDDIC